VLNAGRSDAHKPFLTDFLDGISRAASEESWTLTVATAEDEADEVATMARLVDERKVDGFILPRTKTRDARIALLRVRGVPFILYGRTVDETDCAWFDIDGEGAVRAAVLRLAGSVTGGSAISAACRSSTIRGCAAGVSRRDGEAGLAPDPELMAKVCSPSRMARSCGAALLDHAEPPTAVVCALGRGGAGPLPGRRSGPAQKVGRRPRHHLL
jgi:LacI family transcriptional regulator